MKEESDRHTELVNEKEQTAGLSVDEATSQSEPALTGVVFAPPRPDTRKKPRRVLDLFRRLTIFLLSMTVALIIFAAGNLSAFLGLVDVSSMLGLKNSLTLSLPSAEDEVTTKQLAVRLEEVSRYLDAESLYRYTQGDLDTATTAAINALLETSNDRYAFYYAPEDYHAYQQSSEGEYAGIGIVLSQIDSAVVVAQVYENSPAYAAGIKSGDVLLAVDGVYKAWTLSEATETIRRPSGESVTILWQRDGAERETVMTVRSVIIPTVITQMIEYDGQMVGYLYLRRFNSHSASDLRSAIAKLESAGAKSLILDLRGNPGGYLSQAIEVTSLFLSDGVVVQIEDRKGVKTRAVNGNTVTDLPLVVLINEESASASELVSAALQDYKRALIVGEQSFGKGTVQDIVQLSWGGAIRYTIAHYMSPKGKAIDGVGVTPDVVVPYTSDVEIPGLTDMITSGSYKYRPAVDSQLDAALEVLREQATHE